ncbi:hypothetical protein OIO90_005334 [Microbotryomycetes sp. JL221]|nr:hypothetical protein OIO90_005334 [Microbotryomycetes sp. JL221]
MTDKELKQTTVKVLERLAHINLERNDDLSDQLERMTLSGSTKHQPKDKDKAHSGPRFDQQHMRATSAPTKARPSQPIRSSSPAGRSFSKPTPSTHQQYSLPARQQSQPRAQAPEQQIQHSSGAPPRWRRNRHRKAKAPAQQVDAQLQQRKSDDAGQRLAQADFSSDEEDRVKDEDYEPRLEHRQSRASPNLATPGSSTRQTSTDTGAEVVSIMANAVTRHRKKQESPILLSASRKKEQQSKVMEGLGSTTTTQVSPSSSRPRGQPRAATKPTPQPQRSARRPPALPPIQLSMMRMADDTDDDDEEEEYASFGYDKDDVDAHLNRQFSERHQAEATPPRVYTCAVALPLSGTSPPSEPRTVRMLSTSVRADARRRGAARSSDRGSASPGAFPPPPPPPAAPAAPAASSTISRHIIDKSPSVGYIKMATARPVSPRAREEPIRDFAFSVCDVSSSIDELDRQQDIPVGYSQNPRSQTNLFLSSMEITPAISSSNRDSRSASYSPLFETDHLDDLPTDFDWRGTTWSPSDTLSPPPAPSSILPDVSQYSNSFAGDWSIETIDPKDLHLTPAIDPSLVFAHAFSPPTQNQAPPQPSDRSVTVPPTASLRSANQSKVRSKKGKSRPSPINPSIQPSSSLAPPSVAATSGRPSFEDCFVFLPGAQDPRKGHFACRACKDRPLEPGKKRKMAQWSGIISSPSNVKTRAWEHWNKYHGQRDEIFTF